MVIQSLNPYRVERSLLWRNRCAEWRAHRNESTFHALTWLLLTTLAMLGLWQAWPQLTAFVELSITRWPIVSILVSTWALAQHQSLALRGQRERWSRHWLVAQPIAEALHHRILIWQTLLRAMLQWLSGASLLLGARASIAVQLSWFGIVMLAMILGWREVKRSSRTMFSAPCRQSVFAHQGKGSLWTWQWTEAAAGLAPYRVSRLAWLLLLIPTGHWSAIPIAFVVMALAVAVVAWSRSLAVMPAAQRLLLAQPLPARRLLLGCAAFPLLLLIMVTIGLLGLLGLVDKLQWGLPLATGLAMPALLHWACTAAERHRPARIGLLLRLHLAVLVATLQAMPILLAPVWLVQMSVLLRRGLQK